MRIGILKERMTGETRVAATPKSVKQLIELGFDVAVESGCGDRSSLQMNSIKQPVLKY